MIKGMVIAAMTAILLGGGAAVACGAQGDAYTPPPVPQPRTWIRTTPPRLPALPPRTPAPTTAKGYADMLARVDPAQWGAADVSISVPMPDGKAVWLYGDTFSIGRFVHSTAIVQSGGTLVVSHRGAQLLPNDDATHIYWIDTGKAIDATHISITARSIVLTGTGAWAFKDGGFSHTALCTVSALDVTFVRWTATLYVPPPDPGPLYYIDAQPHHFGYSKHAHPEAKLASGKTLYTMCQNWDDGILHPFADYRPIYSEQ